MSDKLDPWKNSEDAKCVICGKSPVHTIYGDEKLPVCENPECQREVIDYDTNKHNLPSNKRSQSEGRNARRV